MDLTTVFLFIAFFILGYIAHYLIQQLRNPQERDDILRVWKEDGNQKIELDHTVFSDPTILTPGQRARLEEVALELRQWVSVGRKPETYLEPGTDAPDIKAAFPIPSPDPDRPTRLDIFGDAKKVITDMVITNPIEAPGGIVAQINRFLQVKLKTHPLGEKNISLEESKTGEVEVLVGAVRYQGIDSIPDKEIQKLIREAISDWEKSSPFS